MKLNVITLENKKGDELSLNKAVFGLEAREDILHRVVRYQLAKRQTGQHKTKLKSEIVGTTKKPFKQKGTGNARQGDRKGPHMRGGYMAHGPQVRSHAIKLPKKVRTLGLKVALSMKASAGQLRVVDTLVVKDKDAKTKGIVGKLDKLGLKSALFVRGDAAKDGFYNAVQNIPHVDVIAEAGLNVYDILRHDELVITKHALETIEKRLA